MTKTVIPIPPSFNKGGLMIEHQQTLEYLQWLYSKGIDEVMTTAGTSQFNMMNNQEICHFNETVGVCFPGRKILGVPAYNTFDMQIFIDDIKGKEIQNACFMLLYPDRFYDTETLVDYFKAGSDASEGPVYLHDMGMRNGTGGSWEYTADLINDMYAQGIIKGIKEEHSTLDSAFKFVSRLDEGLDVIVAGGSMRRHQFLRHAGANAFLGGIGNLAPEVELEYCSLVDQEYTKEAKEVDFLLQKETTLFETFMKFGWHRSLREGISQIGCVCDYDRMPWPKRDDFFKAEIKNCLEKTIK